MVVVVMIIVTDGGGCDDKSNLVLKSERFKTVELRVLTMPTGVVFVYVLSFCLC